jgi:hypothetical protein
MGMGYTVDDERDGGPHFITSAIDMEDLRSPANSSLDTPPDWKPGEDNKREPTVYRAV